MNYYTPDSLHLVTRERLDQRRSEAANERLAREIRGEHSWRPQLSLRLALRPSRRAGQPRLEP